jgi:hypothetical protein
MGKNKQYRQRLQGQRQALVEHLEKIRTEKEKPQPRLHLIGFWEKTVKNIRAKIAELERKLKK